MSSPEGSLNWLKTEHEPSQNFLKLGFGRPCFAWASNKYYAFSYLSCVASHGEVHQRSMWVVPIFNVRHTRFSFRFWKPSRRFKPIFICFKNLLEGLSCFFVFLFCFYSTFLWFFIFISFFKFNLFFQRCSEIFKMFFFSRLFKNKKVFVFLKNDQELQILFEIQKICVFLKMLRYLQKYILPIFFCVFMKYLQN